MYIASKLKRPIILLITILKKTDSKYMIFLLNDRSVQRIDVRTGNNRPAKRKNSKLQKRNGHNQHKEREGGQDGRERRDVTGEREERECVERVNEWREGGMKDGEEKEGRGKYEKIEYTYFV